jgi:catechol 2,3-dioxygenase-like lactoylglutathione lyase family enzyme
METRELNHVAIHVKDVEATVVFYRDVMGFEPLPRPAFDFPGAWFRLGQIQELHIIGERTDPVFSRNRGDHFALEVESIRDAEAELEAKGAAFRPAKQRPDGAWQIFLKDPDGHVIELCQLQNLDSVT